MLWGKRLSLSLMFFSLLMLGCSASDTSAKALFEKRCSRCHTLDRVYGVKKDAEGWRTTVEKMAVYASGVIPEKEIPLIADYLASVQGNRG